MSIKRYASVVIMLMLTLSPSALSAQTPPDESGRRILVMVTILPLAEFVEQVGGEHVDVEVMLPPGASPHMYEPLPRQLRAVADADLYVEVGEPFVFDRIWMPRLREMNATMDICHASYGLPWRDMDARHAHDGAASVPDDGLEEGSAAGDSLRGKDPHIWLSPANARVMVNHVRDGLSRVDPARAETYAANALAYNQQLTRLDSEIRERLAGLPNRAFMVFHPAWGYFADDYDLTQLSVEVDGKEPSPQQLSGLMAQAQELGIRVVFVSPQFSQHSARAVAEYIRGEVAFLDPLAKNYIENLRQVAATLAQSGRAPLPASGTAGWREE